MRGTKDYVVKSGDTLSKIALRQFGTAGLWPEIAQANHLRSPYMIIEGMRLAIPTRIFDQQHRVSIHAPAQQSNLPDHISIHAPVQNFNLPDHVSVHAPARATNVGSISQSFNFGDRSAAVARLPTLRISIKIDAFSLSNPLADVALTIKGDIILKNKGSITELKLGIDKNQTSWSVKSFDKFFSAEGEFTGTDKASMAIKSAYRSKVFDLVGSPTVEYDPSTQTGSVSCQLAWDAKVNGHVVMTSACRVDTLARTVVFSISSGEFKGESDNYEFSAKVGFEVVMKFKKWPPEKIKVPVNVRTPDPMKMFQYQEKTLPIPIVVPLELTFIRLLELLPEIGAALFAL